MKRSENIKSTDDTISLLSVKEKCDLSSGLDTWHSKSIPRLEIPSILFHDGPHGLRKQPDTSDVVGLNESEPATCFPTSATSACSFDREIFCQLGEAIGKEALKQRIDVVLGPGINIKRSPLCGRNFEYLSEDPLLTGELASAYVKGLQAQGVGASIKHFAANNQEFCRLISNSQVDERALREIYLKAFEIVVRKAQPWTIMSSYNRINAVYACENELLMTRIARVEWGFEGLFISDWGAVDNRVAAVQAGLDLEMPSSDGYRDSHLLKAYKKGQIEERFLDRAVEKLLELIEKCKQPKAIPSDSIYQENHVLARKILTESAVLLKNNSDLLPLNSQSEVLIVGELAKNPHYQGSGSSRVNPTRQVSLTQAVQARGLGWEYVDGYRIDSKDQNTLLLEEACLAAKEKEVVVVVVGLTEDDEAEGYDRQHLELQPGQNALIKALATVNSNVVVVLQGGGVVTLPWLDEVSAVFFVGLAGQAFGEGCLDLLLGEINPSGKLAETWPLSLADVPSSSSYGQRYNTPYIESLFVGYRYYDSAAKPVRFPFGYGLSYTSFEFSDLQVSSKNLLPGKDLLLKIKLTNNGKRTGKEVVQVYISAPKSVVFRPTKELKGFCKVELEPGETKQVEIVLSYDDFAFWNTQTHAWQVEEGVYNIRIGNCSSNLPMSASVQLEADSADQLPDFREICPQYYQLAQNPAKFSLEQFEYLPGSIKVDEPVRTPGNFDLNSTLWEAKDFWQGRLVMKFALQAAEELIIKSSENKGNTRRTVEASTTNAPLRSFVMGGLPMSVPIGMCYLLNRRLLKGFWFLLRGKLTGK